MQKYQSWENPRCEILRALAKMKPMSRGLCLTCKGGRLLCGRQNCPLLQKIQIQSPIERKLDKTLFGPSPPSLFVGWKGYPKVFVGPLGVIEHENMNVRDIDNPAKWYGFDFNDIVRMRSLLVRSKTLEDIKSRSRLVSNLQELVIASKPVDIEIEFKKIPRYSISFSAISQPMGPTGLLENFAIAENPKIPRKAEKILSDDLRATEMASSLFARKFDVYYISRVLSAGLMGVDKKLVPTRWSITAVDDLLSKEMMKKIRTYPQINEFLVYSNTYLDNHFEILLMPGVWGFEQFEAWAPKTLWTLSEKNPVIAVENEGFEGRSSYAFREGGGYYAGRFAVCEHLEKIKRQATVIVFREIYDSYVMPVGVWEVRENVRHAFMKRPAKFDNLSSALDYIKNTLTIPIEEFLKRSRFLRQKNLFDFLKLKV